MNNSGGPAAIAFRLYSSNIELWNTLDPIRSVVPYYYWKEVYRIPLVKGAFTYDSKDYIIKDFSPVAGSRYGGFFSSNNLFKIVDDGFGNVDIILQNKTVGVSDPGIENTLVNLQYSFFYYALYNSNNQRVNNLSGPEGNGSQTRYFVGFASNGTVRTILVNYPIFGTGSSAVWDNSGTGDSAIGIGFGGVITDSSGNIVTDDSGNAIGAGGLSNAAAAALAAADGFSPGIFGSDFGPGDAPGDNGGSGNDTGNVDSSGTAVF
jgi:hypothetical protein